MAKTYLFCKSSSLGQKSIDDLLHGDMRRAEEFTMLMLRMAHRTDSHGANLYSEDIHNNQFFLDEDCESSWSSISDSWFDGSWDENCFNDGLYAWYGDHEACWGDGEDHSEDWQDSGWQESGWAEDGEAPNKINLRRLKTLPRPRGSSKEKEKVR